MPEYDEPFGSQAQPGVTDPFGSIILLPNCQHRVSADDTTSYLSEQLTDAPLARTCGQDAIALVIR